MMTSLQIQKATSNPNNKKALAREPFDLYIAASLIIQFLDGFLLQHKPHKFYVIFGAPTVRQRPMITSSDFVR